MAKKAFGKLAALLTIAGAAAAGISYLTKYRSFNKELDEDFHDFEDEDDTEVPDSTMSRNYVSLHADKDEFLVAAGDMMNAAKDAASAAKNMVKDAAAIVADNTREAVSVAKDSAQKATVVAEDTVEKADKAAYEKLNKTYDTWNTTIKKECIYDDNVISAELYKLFDNTVKSCEVRIYNVGQANCCYCDLTTKKIFFDIGVARSSKSLEMPLIKSAVQEISTLDADAVILSHWDLDHILGVCYNQKCMEGKIWVVPDFEKLYSYPTISIKRVCNYLIKNGKSYPPPNAL